MTSDFLKNYDMSAETIKKLYDSKLRLAILDALRDDPMRLADLRRVVDANAPNTSTKAKDLEGLGLIEREDGDYKLSQLGKITYLHIIDELSFYATIEKYKDYWLSRCIDFIPNEFWSKIGVLKNSKIFKPNQLNTTHTHDNFIKTLATTKKVFKGISPIFHDDYLEGIKAMMMQGIDIDLIVTQEVLEQIIKKLSKEELAALNGYPKIKMYVCEGLTSGISVSEKFVVLCLVSKTDAISLMDQYLYSEGSDAVKWGNALFDYYKKKSKEIKL